MRSCGQSLTAKPVSEDVRCSASFPHLFSACSDATSTAEMCNPIGGRSVWNVIKPLVKDDTTPLIVLSATGDSTAFFRDLAIGRSGYTSGTIALLAIAQAFSKVFCCCFSIFTFCCRYSTRTFFQASNLNFEKNLLFTFFDAEAWSFAGSKRFVFRPLLVQSSFFGCFFLFQVCAGNHQFYLPGRRW